MTIRQENVEKIIELLNSKDNESRELGISICERLTEADTLYVFSQYKSSIDKLRASLVFKLLEVEDKLGINRMVRGKIKTNEDGEGV